MYGLSCVGCRSSSNKGAAEGTTEVAAEGGQTKISVAAAASLQATFDDELIPLFEKENPRSNRRRNLRKFRRFTAAD